MNCHLLKLPLRCPRPRAASCCGANPQKIEGNRERGCFLSGTVCPDPKTALELLPPRGSPCLGLNTSGSDASLQRGSWSQAVQVTPRMWSPGLEDTTHCQHRQHRTETGGPSGTREWPCPPVLCRVVAQAREGDNSSTRLPALPSPDADPVSRVAKGCCAGSESGR